MTRTAIPWIDRRDILFIAMFAAASFAIENSLGLVLMPIVSGIPLIGGTLSAIPDAAIIFLAAYLIPRRGGILLFAILLLTLSILTPSFGPPGPYKIVIGLVLGLVFEIVLLLGRASGIYILATALAFAASIPVTWLAWVLFRLPGASQLLPKLPILMAIYFVEGAVGAYLGLLLYSTRLGRMRSIQQLRSRHLTPIT